MIPTHSILGDHLSILRGVVKVRTFPDRIPYYLILAWAVSGAVFFGRYLNSNGFGVYYPVGFWLLGTISLGRNTDFVPVGILRSSVSLIFGG